MSRFFVRKSKNHHRSARANCCAILFCAACAAVLAAGCSSLAPGDTVSPVVTEDAGGTGGATSQGSSATGGQASVGVASSTGGTSGIALDCSLVLCGVTHRELCRTERVEVLDAGAASYCDTSAVMGYWLTCCAATCADGGFEYQCGRVPQ